MEKKDEILNQAAANSLVEITKTSPNGTEKYQTVLDAEGKEYSPMAQYIRVFEEYKLVKEKVSKLSRRERDEVEFITNVAIKKGYLVLNEDYTIKEIKMGERVSDTKTEEASEENTK